MCRVLILDDDLFGAETAKMAIERDQTTFADIASRLNDAIELSTLAARQGKPYEVFLIDLLLGPGKNGIEAMKELRQICPDSDAIIFTGYGDSEYGLESYRAGAFRYLVKPFETQELLYLLELLEEVRKNRREHEWQKIFSGMMEETLKHTNFSEVAQTVVEHALKLGFERAHLFWVPSGVHANKRNMLIGVACAGNNSIPNFKDQLFSDWFLLNSKRKSRNPIFLHNSEVEKQRPQIEADGYLLPAGEITILPSWRRLSLAGYLLLDYGPTNKTLSEHERLLLNYFMTQVSLVLDHASMYGREHWATTESEIIRYIGRQITTRAASVDLVGLLEEIRVQVGKLMEVSDFAVALLDENAAELDFRLLYEGGKHRQGVRQPAGQGLEGFLIKQQKEIFLPENVKKYTEKNNILVPGQMPSSWLGAPLRVSDKIIGGISIHQHDKTGKRLQTRDKRLLVSVANQVAGAIQLSLAAEAEKQDAERLNVLRRANMEMLSLAQENEDNLWYTALTLATANFGTGFNRALLLVNDDGTKLVGKTGIGTDDVAKARRDWERDVKRHYGFDDFLEDLRTQKLPHTDFETLVPTIEIKVDDKQDAIQEAFCQRKFILVEEKEIQSRLPPELTQKVNLSTCAVLPLQVGNRNLGVVIVDNKHNKKPIKGDDKALNRLQSVLNSAGLVWETLNQRQKSDDLLAANYQIMGGASHESLKNTLKHICETARKITEANWVMIYPLKEEKAFEFDETNISYAGELQYSIDDAVNSKPSRSGVTAYILKRGELVIHNVDKRNARAGRQHIADHVFIQREGVKAVIGIAIRDPETGESLGVLYLNYRTPQDFSSLEVSHAKSFASLAAVAILSARRFDEQKQRERLEAALQTAEAIGTELDLEKMISKVLKELHKFFKRTTLCVLIYDEDDEALKFAPGTKEFYTVDNPEFQNMNSFSLKGKSLACRVARKALKTQKLCRENVPDVRKMPDYLNLITKTRSELCVSLMSSDKRLLGVLALERTKTYGFVDDDEALVETVAQQLGMAMDRTQQKEKLEFKSTVAAQTAWAADIAHDINNEVGQIRTWAYLIKEIAGEDSPISEFANNIDISAEMLSSAGPWSDQPDQILPLDPMLERYIQSIVHQKNIHADIYSGAYKVYVKVNPNEFQRVLRQLVRNAAKAMKNTAEKKIIVSTQPLGTEKVEILFQDFGPGIVSEEVRSSIFRRPITTKSQGGYGLLLIRQMIEDMQGEIRLLPYQKDRGAIFSIQLPVAVSMGWVEE